uniref:Uncharacterized protein n=1 Tax=Anguilla anguilla TaxID=7936 RepID=A0A0E9VCW1_ANGAN
MVTDPGSPPKLRIFFCTQRSAATWSRNPKFPGACSSPVLGRECRNHTSDHKTNIHCGSFIEINSLPVTIDPHCSPTMVTTHPPVYSLQFSLI